MEYLRLVVERILAATSRRSLLVEARKALIDTLAVAMSAPRVYPKAGRIAGSIAEDAGPALLLGLGRSAPRLEAAMANAFLAHSTEYDDWLAPGYVHAGSIAVPTALSYGLDMPFKRVLQSLVAGYEAGLLVGSYMGRSHYTVFHGTATIGASVAAATYTLLVSSRPSEHLGPAISLAMSYAGGLWTINRAGALYKPLSPAHAVSTGVLAAKAAIVEGVEVPEGLERACNALGGECVARPPEGHGVSLNGFKFYPACRHSHTAIEAALSLQGKVRPQDVLGVRVRLFREAVEVAGVREPRTVEEARFSVPLLVALALSRGRVGFREIEEGLRDPVVRRLARLVSLEADEEFTRAYPERQPAEVVVETRDGTLKSYRDRPRGEPSSSVSLDEILAKAEGLRPYLEDNELSLLRRLAGLSEEDILLRAFEVLGE